MVRSDYNGKRGSNAGDDYHELWAARRALELITPDTDLIALTVEGVRAEDDYGVADSSWDGVDAAFYFGTDQDNPDRVELVQFKYSGSDSTSPWTVARLCYGSNKNKSNSLINRLATAWNTMRARLPGATETGGVTALLVSNQPVSPDVAEALNADWQDPQREKLRVSSGLDQRDFAEFSRALDLSGCGDLSRFSQEERVIRALSAFRDGDVRDDLAILRDFIRKRMLPETSRETITRESVFALFGHADPRTFYPCPSFTHRTKDLVHRAATDTIVALFLQDTRKVCLVGAGGEGKTTVLQDLEGLLPVESELVVYDCYGRGTYLNSDGYRHRAEDALLQLGNEIAARLQLPPTFAENGIDHFRRFARRLAAAAEALEAKSPKALLVLAIDAADNAVTAASRCAPPERAFVDELARIGSLPDNVRLLFSARPGRIAELELPEEFQQVELGPFSSDESRDFVESRLGVQSDDWHSEFHYFSAGNPRVQNYAMEFAEGSSIASLDYLKPNGKDLDKIFGARLKEAHLKAGGLGDIASLSAALVLLPRPVPLGILSEILGFGSDHIKDLALDLAPGLNLVKGAVGFADEDFEHFLGEVGEPSKTEVRGRAATVLWDRRASEEYACSHVAGLLLSVGRRQRVIELVKEPAGRYPIGNATVRGEVQRRRLRAAMYVCSETGNVVEAAALLLEGAQALKTDEAVRRMLSDHVELSVQFARDAILNLILRDRDRRHLHGDLLLHLVGVDGIAQDRIGAKANFRSFMAWQESRRSAMQTADATTAEEEDGDNSEQLERTWRLEPDAAAAMLVGRLHAEGATELKDMLRRPRPRSFRYAVLQFLFLRLARGGNITLLQAVKEALPRLHPLKGMVELLLGMAGGAFDPDAMLSRLEKLAGLKVSRLSKPTSEFTDNRAPFDEVKAVLDACDLVALKGGDAVRLSKVLLDLSAESARTAKAMNDYFSRNTDVAARAFSLARVIAGEPVTFEAFFVKIEDTSKTEKKTRTRENALQKARKEAVEKERKAEELYGPILALHSVRAAILTGSIPAESAAAAVEQALVKHREARRFRTREYEWRQRDEAVITSLFILGLVPGMDCEALFGSIGSALDSSASVMGYGRVATLEGASVIPGFRSPIVAVAVAACETAREVKMSADDKIETLISQARLLLPLDRSAARYCFETAQSVAGDVDYDAVYGISLAMPLANRAQLVATSEVGRSLAIKLAAAYEDTAHRIGGSDRFPWHDAAVSLAALAPGVALAATARFAELDLAHGRSMLAHVLLRLAEDGNIETAVLAAFVPILGGEGHRISELLLERAAASDDAELAETVARHLLLEPSGTAETQERALSRLTTPGPSAQDFIATARFMSKTDKVERAYEPRFAREGSPNVAEEVAPEEFASEGIDDLQALLRRIDRIASLGTERYRSRSGILSQLLDAVPVHRSSEFLDYLTAMPAGEEAAYDLARILANRLDAWDERSPARRWAKDNLLRTIETRLPVLAQNLAYRGAHLAKLLDRVDEAPSEMVARLLSAIETHIDSLDSPTIFQMVGLMTPYLTPEQSLELLHRHTDGLHGRLDPVDREVPGFRTVDDLPTSVARFIYAELGHISHENRWRAAHGLRWLGQAGRTDILELIQDRFDHVEEPAFSHPEAPFYAWSAKLWLMISLARIAWETPRSVSGWRAWFFHQAEREDFPHLLIRNFAKQALEGLAAADPSLFDRGKRQRIDAINTSPFPEVRSTGASWEKGFNKYHSLPDTSRRFRFDTHETLPNTYTPLLRCFADPDKDDFLDRAESWIVDMLGVHEEPWEYDKLRGNHRFNRGDEYSRSGAIPAIERYRSYLEFHALFLAGGEVLSSWPISEPEDGDTWNYFPGWLSRQGMTQAPIWLSDLRSSKPLESVAWVKPSSAEWLQMPSADEFRTAMGLKRPDWLIISTSRNYTYGEFYGTVESESALVSPKTARALRRALESYESPYHYRLPVGESSEHEYGAADFKLRALIEDHEGDLGLDIHDPMRGYVTGKGPLLLPTIVQILGLTRDVSRRPIWRDASGGTVMYRRSWSDAKASDRSGAEHSVGGSDFWIKRSAIAEIIEATGLEPIIELTFNRRIGESSYDRKKNKKVERETDRLVILRSNGRIEGGPKGLGNWA